MPLFRFHKLILQEYSIMTHNHSLWNWIKELPTFYTKRVSNEQYFARFFFKLSVQLPGNVNICQTAKFTEIWHIRFPSVTVFIWSDVPCSKCLRKIVDISFCSNSFILQRIGQSYTFEHSTGRFIKWAIQPFHNTVLLKCPRNWALTVDTTWKKNYSYAS